jgi:Pyruvate/2-oxoacid:ferredoxin oxidoreductase gamma subunit
MERELLMAGIGGQGVQLAAQLMAKAATRSGRHVQLFGSYGGMMRGGNTDATLIIGDEPVQSPPMVSSAWSALVMHHEFAAPTLERLLAGGLLVVNTSVVTSYEIDPSVRVLTLPATELAIKLGAAAAATMVALGAYAQATGMVGIDELIDTLPAVLPSYRTQHIEGNARALRAGAEAGAASGIALAAWPAMATMRVTA